MHKDIDEIILDESQLEKTVDAIAERINLDYNDKPLTVIGILRGSAIFLADLFRRITVEDCTLDFMAASSYGSSAESSGHVNITKDISDDVSGRHVLVVEDILDTGNTLSCIRDYLLDTETCRM